MRIVFMFSAAFPGNEIKIFIIKLYLCVQMNTFQTYMTFWRHPVDICNKARSLLSEFASSVWLLFHCLQTQIVKQTINWVIILWRQIQYENNIKYYLLLEKSLIETPNNKEETPIPFEIKLNPMHCVKKSRWEN